MKNKTLTRIAVSSLITACLMVQPCYAAAAAIVGVIVYLRKRKK